MTWNKSKGNKFRASKLYVEGIKFDSKAEGEYYGHLKLCEKSQRKPFVKILELQPKVYLTDAKILYKPDFLIEENGKKIYIDVKGFPTPTFNLKFRLWKFYGDGILRIVKKSATGFHTEKEICTEGF